MSGERKVQKEHRAPADVFDQPAARDRTNRGSDRAEARPRADRPAPFGIVECGADDRQAARHQEGGADALQRAAGDQHPGDVASAAEDGGGGKEDMPARKTRLRPNWSPMEPPIRIKSAEHQRIRFDDPLDVGNGRVKVGLERRQRDVDDRAVEKRHARRR